MSEIDHRRQHLEPLPRELLRQPLEYILADHLRQRVLCVLCERIADNDKVDATMIGAVLGYIERDMTVHVVDEEQDLFPLIRRRAEPEDDIETILGQLSGEHADDETLAQEIILGLQALCATPGQPAGPSLANALRQFAQHQRQHLALENATVMPLAKLRLGTHDLEQLAARMAARRGILLDTKKQ